MFGIIGRIKRLDRGLVISALGHFSLLAIGLVYLYLGASAHEAPPPEATLVELVRPQDIPHFSGTPNELRTSGSDTAAPRSQPAVKAQNTPPRPEQKQQKPQRDAQHDTKPKTEAPPLRRSETAEIAAPQEEPPDPPAPDAPPAPDETARLAERAQMALLGGRLGGGFAAPPIDSPLVGYDYTEPFRRAVSACAPPVGVAANSRINVRIRVFLNRDGTVAAAPRMREPNPSPQQQAMLESFAAGLEKCQPYTMLPQDKYAQWKQLDLVVFPMQSFGG
jgi:hypothetical protein